MSEREFTAIVVGYVNYGDADRIVTFLSPKLGVVACIAKQSRASQKRFQGTIDLGNKITGIIRPSKGNLWKVREANVVSSRHRLRMELNKIALMTYFCEITGKLAQPETPEPKLFGLLETALQHLEEYDLGFGAGYRIAFESKALSFAGLQPRFLQCVHCRQEIDSSPLRMLPVEGGVFHERCLPKRSPGHTKPLGKEVNIDWLHQAEFGLRSPLNQRIGMPMPGGPHWILSKNIESHLHQKIKSKDFLQMLEKAE